MARTNKGSRGIVKQVEMPAKRKVDNNTQNIAFMHHYELFCEGLLITAARAHRACDPMNVEYGGAGNDCREWIKVARARIEDLHRGFVEASSTGLNHDVICAVFAGKLDKVFAGPQHTLAREEL